MNSARSGNRTVRSALATIAISLLAVTDAIAADIIFVDDFTSSHLIQWVRKHPKAGGASILLDPAYVTASRASGSGGIYLTMYLEVPPALNGNDDYPKRSALKFFGSSSGGIPAAGACVIAEGVIGMFNGATQLNTATWTPVDSAMCGDSPIVPYVVSVADVATDTDTGTAGNQPAATAEPFESVLVKFDSPYILTSNGGTGAFKIGDDSLQTGGYLSVAQFQYQYTAVQGNQPASITGVLDEFDTMTDIVFQLLPRSAADIVE